jgi:hypothetical protein
MGGRTRYRMYVTKVAIASRTSVTIAELISLRTACQTVA